MGRADGGSASTSPSRRPGLFPPGVPPPTRPGEKPPGSGNGGGGHGHHSHHDYPYYYDPFFGGYGYGSGFIPYSGPFGAEDYYLYGNGRYSGNGYPAEGDRWPDSRRGNVQLHVDPRDVQVYVDGVLSARDGRATLNLPTGRWRLELVRPGYRTETVDIEVNQGVSVRVDRRLERLPGDEAALSLPEPQAATGELRLDLKPDDAIVVLDGRAIGLASDLRHSAALRRLPAGRHQIEVRRPGYATLRQEVVISPVQPAVVSGELLPEKG